MIIIGDVHGCFKTLMSLISKLPKDNICFVGDLIDRGPKSCDVVEFVKKEGFACVRGNHEEFMILNSKMEFGAKEYDLSYNGLWGANGGIKTVDSYHNNMELYNQHVLWMENLPLIKKYDDIGLIVSHSSAAEYILSGYNPYLESDLVWERNEFPKKIPGLFNIYGHTPHSEPVIKDYFACIDTGCFITWKKNYGILTALQFPEMKIFQQKNID